MIILQCPVTSSTGTLPLHVAKQPLDVGFVEAPDRFGRRRSRKAPHRRPPARPA
ncbi:hypothetical protein [Saccharopolyspora elongata]|uniref:hypothetical protein n=1 Tax=Saccharopolyspora elongata TaxID=2530387 RepID=UPI001404F131|nr:hypothetical protein [Saccharopolyspora elongata]